MMAERSGPTSPLPGPLGLSARSPGALGARGGEAVPVDVGRAGREGDEAEAHPTPQSLGDRLPRREGPPAHQPRPLTFVDRPVGGDEGEDTAGAGVVELGEAPAGLGRAGGDEGRPGAASPGGPATP